jgi:hypothetical protein
MAGELLASRKSAAVLEANAKSMTAHVKMVRRI